MKISDYILDLIFPPKCVFCHCLVQSSEQKVCGECVRKLPYTQGAGHRQTFTNIAECVSPFYYEDNVRSSLLRYKFGGVSAYAQTYAEYLTKCIDENRIFCDIITWVPLNKKRLRKRGYDQAQLIAEAVADNLKIDCMRLLRKRVNNPAQSGKGGLHERKANVSGVYEALLPELFRDKNVLLIDDIVTTGSTLSECARVLRAAGAAKIYAAAVARKRD